MLHKTSLATYKGMNLQLQKFDMARVAHDRKVVIIGKTDSGKTFLGTDLLHYHQDIPVGTVISGTEVANGHYGQFTPSRFIHDQYKPEIIRNFLKRQLMMTKSLKESGAAHGGAGSIDPRAFLILDDCLYDDSWTRDENMRFLFMNGRHVHSLVIIMMQYPLGIPPILRTNIDYVFIMRENITANRRRIYENYAGMFPTFDLFCQVMDQCTQNYECLVIDNRSKSNKLEDQVFWCKAEAHPNFRLCSSTFWTDNKPFVSSLAIASDDAGDYDPDAMRRTKGPTVLVRKQKF